MGPTSIIYIRRSSLSYSPFLQLSSRKRSSYPPRVSCLSPCLSSPSSFNLLLKEKWWLSSSSPPWELLLDIIFRENPSLQGSLWSSSCYLKTFHVSGSSHFLDYASPSPRESSSPLLGALSFYFIFWAILGFVMDVSFGGFCVDLWFGLRSGD